MGRGAPPPDRPPFVLGSSGPMRNGPHPGRGPYGSASGPPMMSGRIPGRGDARGGPTYTMHRRPLPGRGPPPPPPQPPQGIRAGPGPTLGRGGRKEGTYPQPGSFQHWPPGPPNGMGNRIPPPPSRTDPAVRERPLPHPPYPTNHSVGLSPGPLYSRPNGMLPPPPPPPAIIQHHRETHSTMPVSIIGRAPPPAMPHQHSSHFINGKVGLSPYHRPQPPPPYPPAAASTQQQPQAAPLQSTWNHPSLNSTPRNSHQLPLPTTSPAIVAPLSEDQAWTEHTAPNGMKYYYNSVTKASAWEKPEALKKAQAATTKPRPWTQYTDAGTGKTYYSNGITTSWEKPADFEPVDRRTTATATIEEVSSEPPQKKKKPEKKNTNFASKDEAVAAFKGLLLAKDISPIMKWSDVVKVVSSDSRWENCQDVLTIGERRQSLAEYQTKRANELRTLERQERQRSKEAFQQLLAEVLPTVSGFSAWKSRFHEFRDSLAKDDRFHAVADDATRDSLFLDFCEESRKRDERRKRNKKREAEESFIMFLKEKQEIGKLTFASTWNSFASLLDELEHNDARFVASVELSDADRQLHFADFVLELQTSEDDKRRRIRDARRRAEKAQREAFRTMLQHLATEGKLLPSSRWRSVEELLTTDPSFAPVQEQDRDAPRELFEDFVDEWNELYRRDRALLSRLVNSKSDNARKLLVTSTMAYDDFVNALLDEAADSPEIYGEVKAIIFHEVPVSSARLYFNELHFRAKGIARPILRLPHQREEDSSEDEGEIIEDGEAPESVNQLARDASSV